MAINRIHITLFAICLIIGLWTYACMKEQIEPTFYQERLVRLKVSNTDIGAVLQMKDCELRLPPGILGDNPNAPPNEAIFSISRISTFPKALPPEIQIIRGPFHFGPEGIVFPTSTWILFDAPFEYNFEEYSIFTFDFSSDRYVCYPITYLDEEHHIVGTAVYQLGFFFLGRHSTLHTNTTEHSRLGGFELHGFSEQWYPIDGNNWQPVLQNQTGVWEAESNFHQLSLQQITFDDRAMAEFYIDPHKWSIETPPQLVSWEPDHVHGLHYIGPPGTFEWGLKIKHREAFQSLSQCQEYSELISTQVASGISCDGNDCKNWSPLPAPPFNGTWQGVLCHHQEWAPHTPPCTGDLEITLGWHNAPENTTDLDLYLLGPDGLRVYWGMMEGPADIRLEQDATNQQGFVFENICAPDMYAMPRGLYDIRINNFDGQEKRFQVRVIRGSYLQQYYGVISPGESIDIEVFRLR